MSDSARQTLPERPDPNIPQQQAAIPEHDIWVAASAGSGKTKVLTDRVLRLLLPDPNERWMGTAPHRILCITFTKAAAALMSLRVQKKLSDWAVMDEKDLHSDLQNLLGVSPPKSVMDEARKLFSTVLDASGGLSIMTIHAFCQSTLGRFAIEAGVAPGFTVIEESAAQDILRHIIDDLILSIERGEDKELKSPFERIATYCDLDKLRETLLAVTGKSREISRFLAECRQSTVQETLLKSMGYNPSLQFDVAESDLLTLSRIMSSVGGKSEKEQAQKIAEWIALSQPKKLEQLCNLQDAFLTGKGELRKPTKAITNDHPEFFVIRDKVLGQIEAYLDNQAIARQAEQTSDLLKIAEICLERYSARKRLLNGLDFTDLILKTRTLLESQNMDWVQYKLDEGIDHILVDEAQDTNIHQWEIIRHLSAEFLAGETNNQRLRSLFVVGDEKQSIFSFHGANPEAFQEMRHYFSKRSTEAGRTFNPVNLETSFRTTRPILELVDMVFSKPHMAEKIGLRDGRRLVHYSYRDKAAGLIELWDCIFLPKTDTKAKAQWVLPLVSSPAEMQDGNKGTSSALVRKIALTISSWLQKGERLKSTNKPIEPRDILVLVRTRTSFVPDLVRQLKNFGIPVSGADRMKLTEQIAVMDCLALARFARFPDDDLSLACVLRSPFIRMSEEALMNLALNRSESLWETLQKFKEANLAIDWLKRVILKSKTEKPFDFFDDILNAVCPFDGISSGWKAFTTCLGADCIDPLDEFLSYCLSKEDEGVFSLEELVALLQSSTIEIKRDTEEGDKDGPNQVRIMTVHASKGLEAPIVFLPDTIGVPGKGKIDALQWIENDKSAIPLWSARTSDGCRLYKELKDESYDAAMAEYMRLLYVALTRPKDRLYIMGESKSEKLKEDCWYNLIRDAFLELPHKQISGGLRIETDQIGPVSDESEEKSHKVEKSQLPSWVFEGVEDDNLAKPKVFQPSLLLSKEDVALSPSRDGDGTDSRFLRGNLTHKLFQILPELPDEARKAAAQGYLHKMGSRLNESVRESIISETLNILNDPVFADVFGKNSLAEVPVSGPLGDGRMISGQIDRLVIGHNRVLIVDFKTNRPSPASENDIPAAYISQLKAYKTAISRIFPEKEILCALLWTDKPLLMPVSV